MSEDRVPPTDVRRLPTLADEVLETLMGTAGTAKRLETIAEDILEEPEHLTAEEERAAARETLRILGPVLEGDQEEQSKPATRSVPEELLPDDEVVLGELTEGEDA